LTIPEEDLRIDIYRPPSWDFNRKMAIRITHVPSGTEAIAEDFEDVVSMTDLRDRALVELELALRADADRENEVNPPCAGGG